jgi:hypothetical protein
MGGQRRPGEAVKSWVDPTGLYIPARLPIRRSVYLPYQAANRGPVVYVTREIEIYRELETMAESSRTQRERDGYKGHVPMILLILSLHPGSVTF